jgi:hypothetical protein
MHATAAEVLPGRRRKTPLVTLDSIDGRTHAARKVHALMRSYQRELGRKPNLIEAEAIQRAAVLQAIAEDARVRFLRGDKRVTYDAVVRADNCARRALRDLRAIGNGKREPEEEPPSNIPSYAECVELAKATPASSPQPRAEAKPAKLVEPPEKRRPRFPMN